MLNAIHEVMLYAHTCTWSEALSSMLYKKESFMLIAIHG